MIRRLLSRLTGKPASPAIPDRLWQETVSQLPFLARRPEDELAGLRELTARFLAEKEFAAVGGLALDDRICLTIAVQACLPVLKLGLEWYGDWIGIVVYPDEFVIPRSVQDEDGIVHEYDEPASGEAWGGGPVLVSWRDVQMAGDGYNVVIHEFVHKLDMRNGEADGMPPLPSRTTSQRWQEVLLAAYDDFCAEVDAADARGEETLIDPYASEHPGEFFAVLAEAFFETPEIVVEKYPALYEQFVAFFRFDPRT
jgi:Mlc titration factor MtfA (ptsG expression regulator)